MKMTYREFSEKTTFSQADLIAFAYGRLVSDPPEDFDGRLPAPPFLMMDRINAMTVDGRKGRIVAEMDVRLDAWFFQCHMAGDPVMPGCLYLDAIWQILGFHAIWRGGRGTGRALGSGEVSFSGQIRPFNKVVRYEVDVKRFSELKASGATLIIGDGSIFVDDELIATVKDAKTGIFRGIVYRDYPHETELSRGGIMRRDL